MNSLISYDWLKQYVTLKETPDEFAKRISLSGPGVEKIIPQGELLANVVVGRIQEVLPHPNADKLRITKVDIGKKVVQIVCGGSNLSVDQWVAVGLPGARVRWHGEGEPVVLAETEIRGEKSFGMICAASEIGLFDAFPHAEREILDLKDVGAHAMRPGIEVGHLLGLSDNVVMDVEVTSNRVDAMGMVGMAREAAAILNRPFVWKAAKLPKSGKAKKGSSISVQVKSKKLCPRYMAVRIDGVKIGPSPWWLKRRLLSAGFNSINNIVDITNFVLLELAQPLHAFDATKIQKGIDVRTARAGETIKALDGKDYTLEESMLVIADAVKPVAIAGIMGGEESSIASDSTSIILEAATFDSVSIRRTARALNIQTDAQLRYEKGLSTEALPDALARAIELVLDVAGGQVVSAITDVRAERYKAEVFKITTDEVNALIGVSLPPREMVQVLKRLGFTASLSGKTIKATVPWWRDHDIELARDLVEEIARVYGYANIPPVVPIGLASRPIDPELVWEDRVKDIAKGAGLIETYSYSFVSKELLAKAGYDATSMLHVQNPLSADLEVMRTTLLPSLLQIASENREKVSQQHLFEVANVYYPMMEGWKNLPDEQLEFGALFLGMKDSWKTAKGFVEHLLSQIGIQEASWKRLSNDSFWHPGRTVQAFVNGELVATVGEISPKIADSFKLEHVAMIDMPLEKVFPLARMSKHYTPASSFPSAKRDLAVIVDVRSEYHEIAREIKRVDACIQAVEWFDTYTGKNLPHGKKSLAMHLEFSAPDRTLESKEVDAMMEKITLRLKEAFEAEIRSA